ncbi:MAG: hypothetical protein PHE93_01680 [Clostridia bacterium]|nr:hypothetical protein [Clostridia bacterium]
MKGTKRFLNSKIAILLIVCLFVVAGAVGLTVSKYVSANQSSTYVARVAKWDVSVGKALTSVDVFEHTDANVDYDGNGTEKIIAPGTTGLFTYELTNNAEVAATYAVQYDVDEAGVYLQWSTDGTNWTNDLTSISKTAIAMGETVSKQIYWKWAFEAEATPIAEGQSDENDTMLGVAGTATPSVTIDVTFEQAD